MSKVITKILSIEDHLGEEAVGRMYDLMENRIHNVRDFELFIEWMEDMDKWKEPMVSFDTFLDDPMYLGVGALIYPQVREIARSIVEGKYTEGIFVGGIGSGKTTAAELAACYFTHKLLCMRDPHKTYELAKDKPITIINMGTTATQALENCFTGIRTLMEKSPWFNQFNPYILTNSIRFNAQNVLLMSGNSKSTTPLGFNIFYAVLDEAAFYLDNDNKQIAEEIYTALQRRIVSRFGYDGLILMISSPRYEGDFIMRKLEDAKRFPDLIYSAQLPTWKCKPLSKADTVNKFYFNNRKGLVQDLEPSMMGKICKLEDKFDPLAEIWEIPGEYKKSFLEDPGKAKRDFAAIPSMTIQAFMPHPEIIAEMFTEERNPVQPLGGYKFLEPPLRVNYYIHVDLALNRDGKGDKAGFAMAHFDGWEENEETGERQKRVKVDLAEQILKGPTGEISFEDVRNKIYALQSMGYNIKLVTLDQFQSVDTIQILKSKGIRADYLSVDRTVEPYQTLKSLIYSRRIKCHQSTPLQEELQRIEITKANKIDHPPGGSKDVADAVCGAVHNVIIHTGGEIGMMVGDYETMKKKPLTAKSEKEQYYEEIQKLVDEGVLT